MDDQLDYYICNPYTMRTGYSSSIPSCQKLVPVGFICEPYYNYEEEDGDYRKEQIININADYKCKVVRVVSSDIASYDITIQIFSSETGEWRESVVLSPGKLSSYGFDRNISFASNGMLYWRTYDGNPIGLGTFVNNNESSASDHYQCRLIEFDDDIMKESFTFDFLGVYQGFLRFCSYDVSTCSLFVWELTEEEHGQLVVKGPGKYGLEHGKGYTLPQEMISLDADVEFLICDPDDGDILYIEINGEIVKCNIRTKVWSQMARTSMLTDLEFFPLELPWWPTPVPRLPALGMAK